ncbi:MAG TPA: acyl-CoA reductase, partial [Candidatus Acidoferrales bacterium]|nr:acyl-CoA reductase [Candidatus Acidoferrales bacterium]
CVVVAPWRGGDVETEEAVFAQAALVVASGSDAAIESLRRRAPARFIGHGHKVSFAAIGRECLQDERSASEWAKRLAYDVSLWDQQGCLSPQLCYVEDEEKISPTAFAEMIAAALSALATDLPPRVLNFEERCAVQRFRQEAEWHDGGKLLASAGTEWSVSVERTASFRPTCLNRCLRLLTIDDLGQLSKELPRRRRHLEAAGLAVGGERLGEIAALLSSCGVHRICPLGSMQTPSLRWRQSGRPRVADWVEWCVVEDPSA